MMCAARAGLRGRRVLLVDHFHSAGEKIRISGGGRCNFTNLHTTAANFLSQNPDFCRSALARFTPRHFIDMVEAAGIAHHEKTLGQLFCDDSAQQIIDLLLSQCAAGGVELRLSCAVQAVGTNGDGYRVETSQGGFEAASLVVATGGLSVPKIGASPLGYRIASQFGLNVIPPRPGLVPLSFDGDLVASFEALAGISLDAGTSCNGGRFREGLLLTHRGLSGPSILQISSYWQPGDFLSIDLLPGEDGQAWLLGHRDSKQLPANLLAERLPRRLAVWWCQKRGWTKPAAQLAERALRAEALALADWQIRPAGTAGWNKAEVTLGGVDTRELSSRTMAARAIPGLFFVGEVVDVTGHLGGFNFQWAWASGHAAGEAL